MTATLTQEEVKATHADRPHARDMLPFRIVNKGRFNFLQWDSSTIGPYGKPVVIPFDYPIEESPGQFGLQVARLQERCAVSEAEVDGLLAKIDGHVADKVALERQVKDLQSQVAELKRVKSNGRKES